MMALHIFEFNPFICDLSDLDKSQGNLDLIKKRQIITPFSLRYYYSKLLQWRPVSTD